ncbi:MAG: DUF5110 domain-containing protein [Bacteroidaceae bacterium]|nr:DUF5110 domain-containing protein [Bacteroidaceae bacterium]
MKNLFLCFLATLFALSLPVSAYNGWDGQAAEEAMVTSGNVRFTVLTPEMIRIQVSATRTFDDRATFAVVNRRLPVPAFTTETKDGYLFIRTEALELRYLLGSTPKATDQSTKNLQISFQLNGQTVVWYPGKDDSMNLLGTTRTLDTAWGDGQRDRLEHGLLSRAGWAIVDESPCTKRGDGSTTFALADNADGFPWWEEPADKAATDWYFMGYGHDYMRALGDWTKVAGRVPLPPKYIFGYWYSRYWAYSQSDFMRLVSEIEANDLPLDVMIMDMDWHKSGWTGWSWNKSLIPNPTNLIDYFHNHGLRTALNLHPADGIASYEDNYDAIKAELGYGADYRENIPWKLDDYTFYQSFFKNLMRVREAEGVDFWWLDWQQWLTSPYTEGLGETFWLNHVYFTDMEKYHTTERPVIYHRWGGLGSHRYPICFSGDTFAAWSTLAYEIPFTSMASNVCYTYWGHDIGGHQGGNNDPELMQRWLQFGVFTPIFRTHATNDSKLERRIWKYSNYAQLLETVRLRYRLFPYLYTAARETYDTGVGMCRPLYYHYPESDLAYHYEDEYMFGRDILVAPIYTPSQNGVSRREIWLPEGTWYDVSRNEPKQGGRIYADQFTTDEFPYFFRAGAIVPQYPTQRTVQTTPDTIVLKVVPGADGEGVLYEDKGDNQEYRNGQYTTTGFRQTWDATGVTVEILARQGAFEGMPTERVWRVEVLGAETVVIPKGDAGAAHTLHIDVPQPVEPVAVGRPDNESSDSEDYQGEPVAGQLYISGSAVPGGEALLEPFLDGTFKYHGRLLPGELYIANKATATATTKYCKPKVDDATIVTAGTTYTATYGQSNAAWHVAFESDHYRFTVNPATLSLKGEIFTPWYECWIVGGCTADGQQNGWKLDLGKELKQRIANPEEWEWTGYLAAYPNNEQARRFKIYGQFGWAPKTLSPYSMDANILTARQVVYNNPNDFKWQMGDDGYYRIHINPFRETIQAEYLGTTLPDGLPAIGDKQRPDDPQRPAPLYDLQGRKVDTAVRDARHQRGIYIRNREKIIFY